MKENKYDQDFEGVEPQPSEQMIDSIEGMRDELRRPMMLIVSAVKR